MIGKLNNISTRLRLLFTRISVKWYVFKLDLGTKYIVWKFRLKRKKERKKRLKNKII